MDAVPGAIRFYLDNHISKAVMIQLGRRGIDIVHCDDVGLADASDLEQLEHSTDDGRVLVSQDRDFSSLHKVWQREGRVHSGIMLLPSYLKGQAQISFTVKALTEYDEMIRAGTASIVDDVFNQLLWL